MQQASISTWVSSSTFVRGSTVVFRYYLLGGDSAMPGGLYAGLCHTFLVYHALHNVSMCSTL